MPTTTRILVIEDDRKVLRGLERGLRAEGYEVAVAADGDEGLRLGATQPFSCVVLDLMLPGRPGLEVLADLVRHKNRVVTREMLCRDVWKERDYALTNVIEVYINTLRRKLERPDGPPLIETLRGQGYSLRGE